MCFFPNMALGSSAIGKVSGQNCFRTLYGSLGQILGPPKGSAEGSTKVLQVSCCRWFSGADPFWAAKRFRLKKVLWKVHQDSTKVSPRFHQGLTKVAQVRDLSGHCGVDPFWGAKRFCGRFPHHFFKLVSQFRNSFLHFSPTALALGSSAIVKVLGQNDTLVFWGSLQQMAFASQKVSPNSSLHWSHSLLPFFGQMAVASEKVLWRVPPTVLYIYLPFSSWGGSCVNC